MDGELKKALIENSERQMERTLDYVQVAVPDEDTWRVLRSKLLRVGNDAIRRTRSLLEEV